MKLSSSRLSIIGIIAILIFNILAIYFTQLDLYADEAQYWYWSLKPEFGYYSKPPMIAWLINFTTKLIGSSEFGIRFSSPLLYAATSIIIYNIGRQLFEKKIGVWASLIFLFYPAVMVGTQLISTDAALLFFWSLSLLRFIYLQQNITFKNIFWLGVSLGMGMMSKYNMGLWCFSMLLYLLLSKSFKNLFWALFASSFIALIIFIPNLLWNFNNHFVSILHTAEITKLDRAFIYPAKFLEFLIGQILIIGPVFSWIFITKFNKIQNSKNNLLMISFAAFPIIFIAILSLVSGANINWAAPGFVTLTLLIAQLINLLSLRSQSVIAVTHIILFLAVKIIFIANLTSIPGLNRCYGHKQIGQQLNQIYHANPGYVIFDDRKLMAWSLYYSQIPANKLWKLNNGAINDHFDLTKTMPNNYNGKIIFVSRSKELAPNTKMGSFVIKNLVDEIENSYNKKQKLYIFNTANN